MGECGFRVRFARVDVVVPLGQVLVADELESGHLLLGDLDAGLVLLAHADGADLQPGAGGRGADVVEDRLPAVEGSAGPVAADGAEEAVFDGVPLVMRNGA